MGDEIKRALGAAVLPRVNATNQRKDAQSTIVVVGNAPVAKDHTALVDRARWVYRFNRLDNYGHNTGTRTDFWILASHRVVLGQLAAAGHPGSTKDAPPFREVARAVQRILFAVPCLFRPLSESAQRSDLAERAAAARSFLRTIDSTDTPAAIHTYQRSVLAHLDPALCSPERPSPSNGYLTIASLIEHSALHQCNIAVIGFTWKGWQGHPWEAEERALRSFAANGQLSIIE